MSQARKLAVGLLCAVAVLSIPATALAVFPGVNGKLLIASGRGTGGDANAGVYILDDQFDLTPDGPIDLIPGQHRHASWSADGRFITYAIRFGGDDDLFVHDVKLGSTVILGTGSAAGVLEDHPTFSPDGASIAYESEVTNGSNQEDILISPADGTGSITNLTNTGTAVEQTPVWSPDGQFIYYARKVNMASTDEDIYKQPAGGGTATPVSGMATAANEFQPEISPDGKKLCYTRGPFGSADGDVMVAAIDGSGSPVEISPTDDGVGGNPPPTADYDCAWSPDGSTIAFTDGAFGAGQIMFAPADDSGPITGYGNNSTFFDGNVDWSRDQRTCDGKLVTILGTPLAEQMSGTSGPDVVLLLGGRDVFNGKGGNDSICGGKGNDSLAGGKGRDHLFGKQGKDHLNGGADKDKCVGGQGHDKAKHCERKESI